MPHYQYTGRDARGEKVSGVSEGDNSTEVANQLLRLGITPIAIEEQQASALQDVQDWWRRQYHGQLDAMVLILFSRQLSTLLKAGVPILNALDSLQRSADSKMFAHILADVHRHLANGLELSMAMHKHPSVFSPLYINMVHMGEMTGTLDTTFLHLHEHLMFERAMKEQMRAAMRYPLFVLSVMGLAMIVINMFVIPSFAKVFAGFQVELPLITRMLLGFSDMMLEYWPWMLLTFVLMIAGCRAWIHTEAGLLRWDAWKFRLPVVGSIFLKGTLARFSRGLSLAYRSGVPIVQALGAVSLVVGNAWVQSKIEQMRDGISRGDSLLQAASNTGVFSPAVLQMMAIGEETGDLDGLMTEIAEVYEGDVQYDSKMLAERIEPILILMLGVLILILALGVFLPMWDLGKVALSS